MEVSNWIYDTAAFIPSPETSLWYLLDKKLGDPYNFFTRNSIQHPDIPMIYLNNIPFTSYSMVISTMRLAGHVVRMVEMRYA
jgi:hypothetical protein